MAELKWDIELEELEEYFKTISLPESIVVTPYTRINDVTIFIEKNLAVAKQYNGKYSFLPYLHRLRSLRIYFEENREAYPPLVMIPTKNRVA